MFKTLSVIGYMIGDYLAGDIWNKRIAMIENNTTYESNTDIEMEEIKLLTWILLLYILWYTLNTRVRFKDLFIN